MPLAMAGREEEAYRNLQLDANFFQHLLRRDNTAPEDLHDFDVYLMEKSLMPLLVQALDELSRHVDKITTRRTDSVGDPDSLARFNPLVWLAQYLLRNHPRHVKDHRTPMYNKFSAMAGIERGRRQLLRRQPQIEEAFQKFAQELDQKGEKFVLSTIPDLIQRLDDFWFLGGAFREKLPLQFAGLVECREGTGEVLFLDFWTWFEAWVKDSDVIRAEKFVEATQRKQKQEQQAEKAQEDLERRKKAMQEALKQRTLLEEKFEMFSADMYINDEVNLIINKGHFMEGVEEREGGIPLQGEHVVLIRAMLSIWGCPVASELPEHFWNDAALATWQSWQRQNRPKAEGSGDRVDGDGLRGVMDKIKFQEYLERAFPMKGLDVDVGQNRTVEVKGVVEEDIDIYAEAVDDETGELLHFALAEHQIDDVRQRLAEAEGGGASAPLYATVDAESRRVLALLPPDP